MKLNPKAAALASGLIWGVVAILCYVFVAVWPIQTTAFAGWWAHIDLSSFSRKVTASSFVGGFIFTFASAYVLGWAFAILYNKFSKE